MKNDNYKIDILRMEHEAVGRKIHELILSLDKILALAGLVILSVLGFKLTSGLNTIIALLPIPFFTIVFYGLSVEAEFMSLAGYKQYIEEKLNKAIGETTVFWESGLVSKKYFILPHRYLSVFYFLIGVIICSASLITLIKNEWWWWLTVWVILFLLSFAALVRSIKRVSSMRDESYRLCKEILSSNADIQAADDMDSLKNNDRNKR